MISLNTCTELILNISEDDNNTVYCCRATTMQGTQEASFTLVISPPHQSVSPSQTLTISVTSTTMEISVVSDDPPSRPKFKDMNHNNLLTGGVIIGVVFTLVALLTLVSIYFRKRKRRERVSNKLIYSFNGSRKDATEHTDEANWMGDPETGLLIATLTSRSNPSLSAAHDEVLFSHRGRLEIPFSALDLQEKLGGGTFGETFKGTLRNLDYPHRQPKPCVIKLLKSNLYLSPKSASHFYANFFLRHCYQCAERCPAITVGLDAVCRITFPPFEAAWMLYN